MELLEEGKLQPGVVLAVPEPPVVLVPPLPPPVV